jgi:hypothetical protein
LPRPRASHWPGRAIAAAAKRFLIGHGPNKRATPGGPSVQGNSPAWRKNRSGALDAEHGVDISVWRAVRETDTAGGENR